MSALSEEKRLSPDINLVFDLTEKPNRSQLKADKERAVIARLKADLILPTNKVLTVEIDFDSTSGYHNTSVMVMDDFGVEMMATAFDVKYSKSHGDKIRQAWAEKLLESDPRKPSYLLVQKPTGTSSMPKVISTCGGKSHPPTDAPTSIL